MLGGPREEPASSEMLDPTPEPERLPGVLQPLSYRVSVTVHRPFPPLGVLNVPLLVVVLLGPAFPGPGMLNVPPQGPGQRPPEWQRSWSWSMIAGSQ